MKATTYIRRVDRRLVKALQYTGDNGDDPRAWVGPGFHVVAGDPPRVYVSRDADDRGDEVFAGDWVVRDDERVYAVRSYTIRSHCREVPVE